MTNCCEIHSVGVAFAFLSCMQKFSWILGSILLLQATAAYPQTTPGINGPTAPVETPAPDAANEEEQQQPADRVEVRPVSSDEEIASRLQRILEATDWYDQPKVRVEEGVAFLNGETDSEDLKTWAGNLARNTRDVVAVVNHIKIAAPPLWDLSPAKRSLRTLWHGFLRTFPLALFGLVVMVVAWFAGVGTTRFLRYRFSDRDNLTRLLREVIARAAGVGVFLLGLYLVLLVVGLARLAVTVLGGTGLVGLIIGIAFRDITENFLASIFLSIQRPFRTGDLIEVNEITGYVQRLTVRTTVLMTLDGNHVQVPNSTVYKSNILNFTSNPNRREIFTIGIGYDDPVPVAQEVALQVLKNHPAVLKDPEPAVLVDKLGPSTVELKVYFWLDGTKNSWLKVRSSVIRLVKREFQEQNISMPDEAREVIISREVPISLRMEGVESTPPVFDSGTPGDPTLTNKIAGEITEPDDQPIRLKESDTISTAAEGGLSSEAETVSEQARHARIPEEGKDLLQ